MSPVVNALLVVVPVTFNVPNPAVPVTVKSCPRETSLVGTLTIPVPLAFKIKLVFVSVTLISFESTRILWNCPQVLTVKLPVISVLPTCV